MTTVLSGFSAYPCASPATAFMQEDNWLLGILGMLDNMPELWLTDGLSRPFNLLAVTLVDP